MLRITASIFVTLLLTACVTEHGTKMRNDTWNNASNGMLFGSITEAGDKGLSERSMIEVASLDNENVSNAWIDDFINQEYRDFGVEDGKRGRVFVMELPVGTYYLRAWAVNNGLVRYDLNGAPGTTVEVSSGQMTYIGNFDLKTRYRIASGLWGPTHIVTGTDLKVANELERDIALLRQKYAALNPADATTSLLEPVGDYERNVSRPGPIFIPIFIQ